MKESIKSFISKNLKWIIVFICLIVFLAIAEDVFDKDIIYVDMLGYQLVSHMISDAMTPIMKSITNFGGIICLLLVGSILSIVIKNKKIGIAIWLNLAVITVLNIILKGIVQRPRPTEFKMIDESGYSFPSGHSMISMAFYGFMIYLVYKYIKNKYLRWSLIVFLGILIILIGVSRIYLGVHYTSDVVAGFLISISYLIIYIGTVKKHFLDSEK